MTELLDSFLEYIISALTSFAGIIIASIFSILQLIFDKCYNYIVLVFTDSYFETAGSDFFETIFNKTQGLSLSFNIVYWVVGLFLVLFVVKNVIFPLITLVIDNIHDLFTPS